MQLEVGSYTTIYNILATYSLVHKLEAVQLYDNAACFAMWPHSHAGIPTLERKLPTCTTSQCSCSGVWEAGNEASVSMHAHNCSNMMFGMSLVLVSTQRYRQNFSKAKSKSLCEHLYKMVSLTCQTQVEPCTAH